MDCVTFMGLAAPHRWQEVRDWFPWSHTEPEHVQPRELCQISTLPVGVVRVCPELEIWEVDQQLKLDRDRRVIGRRIMFAAIKRLTPVLSAPPLPRLRFQSVAVGLPAVAGIHLVMQELRRPGSRVELAVWDGEAWQVVNTNKSPKVLLWAEIPQEWQNLIKDL